MKIWITRHSAFGIQVGGLERLDVWFSKPEFHLIKLELSVFLLLFERNRAYFYSLIV